MIWVFAFTSLHTHSVTYTNRPFRLAAAVLGSPAKHLSGAQRALRDLPLADALRRTDEHPDAVFADDHIDTDVLADALVRIGEAVADQGISGDNGYRAARNLLLRVPPAIMTRPVRRPEETALETALRIAPKLSGVLPIQGPPGAGKTFIGARMICELVAMAHALASLAIATRSSAISSTRAKAASISFSVEALKTSTRWPRGIEGVL